LGKMNSGRGSSEQVSARGAKVKRLARKEGVAKKGGTGGGHSEGSSSQLHVASIPKGAEMERMRRHVRGGGLTIILLKRSIVGR